MVEMIANHISARVPGTENEFLINPYGMLYEEMTASSMIKIDIDGNVLFNATEYGVNQAGYVIHSAIHAARHDVDCIIHTHTLAGMAVSAMKCGILPIAQIVDALQRHRLSRLRRRRRCASTSASGWSRASATAKRWCCAITACSPSGRRIPECFNNMYRLERACQLQVMALSCNTELQLPPDEVVQYTNKQLQPGHAPPLRACSNGRRCCASSTASTRVTKSNLHLGTSSWRALTSPPFLLVRPPYRQSRNHPTCPPRLHSAQNPIAIPASRVTRFLPAPSTAIAMFSKTRRATR